MTDPTPQPTPVDELVERVARKIADYSCANEVEEFEREFARAVGALWLAAAAQALSDADNKPCAKCGHPRNNHPYRHPFVGGPSADPVAVVRAMMPEKPD